MRQIYGVFASLFVVLLTGCAAPASQYHIGGHYFGNSSMAYSLVSEKVDLPTQQVEENFAHALSAYNQKELVNTFSAKLRAQLDDEKLAALLETLKQQYSFTGQYDRILLGARRNSRDAGVTSEPFDYYDFVSIDFGLKGSTDVYVSIYTTAIDSEIKVCGFAIYPIGTEGSAKKPAHLYIVPESVDKAKIMGRGYVIVK